MIYKVKNKKNIIIQENKIARFLWKSRINTQLSNNLLKNSYFKIIILLNITIILIISYCINLFYISLILLGLFILGYDLTRRLYIIDRKLKTKLNIDLQFLNNNDSKEIFVYRDEKGKPRYDILIIKDSNTITICSLFKIVNPSIRIYNSFEDFIRGIYGEKDLTIFWYQINEPLDYKEVMNLECVKENAKIKLLRYPEVDRNKILIKVGGIWRSKIIFGTKIKINGILNHELLNILIKKIEYSRFKLVTNFQAIFPEIKIDIIDKTDLFELLRNFLLNDSSNNFYISGIENVNHFLLIPRMAVKSINSKYPAEFTVPTDLIYDIGPIGITIETEFQSIEKPVGLLFKHLKNWILTCGDDEFERFKINTKLIYEMSISECPFIIITSNKNYRFLDQYIEDISIFPFGLYGINIFDNEKYDRSKYISELEKIFKIVIPKTEDYPLLNLLTDLYNENEPNLNSLGILIEDKLKNEFNELSYKEKQALFSLNELIRMLLKNETASFFALNNLKIDERIHNSIFEIDISNRIIRRFIILLLILKITIKALTTPTFGNSLILLIDDADFIFQKESLRSGKYLTENEATLIELTDLIKSSSIILFISTSNPKNIIPDILIKFGNVFVSRTKLFENILSLRPILNLQSNYGETSDDHISLFYSDNRKYGYQFEFLGDLESNEYLLKRPDVKTCFPIVINSLQFRDKDYPLDIIKNKICLQFPELIKQIKNEQKYLTKLEKDFNGNIEEINDVNNILSILMEYPDILYSALFAASGIRNKHLFDYYLNKLLKLKYIRYERISDKYSNRNNIKITSLGEQVYQEYNKLMEEGAE